MVQKGKKWYQKVKNGTETSEMMPPKNPEKNGIFFSSENENVIKFMIINHCV